MRKPINLISGGLMGLVVGASSFVNGCEEPQGRYNDNQQQGRYDAGQAGLDLLQFTLGLYGVAGDGTSQQRNAAGFTSNLIGKEKRDEAIRKSGTTVNVYNGQPQSHEQIYRKQNNSPKIELFCYDYATDRNGNGSIETEEINKRVIFSKHEKAILSANFYWLEGNDAKLLIYKRGTMMAERNFIIESNLENVGFSFEHNTLEAGEYSASLYINGKIVDSTDFFIID